jgi:transposase
MERDKGEGRSQLEVFRRLKSEVRGSTKHLLVGIDVAKDKHHAFFGTATGHTVAKRLIFDNRRYGFEHLRAFSADLQSQHGLSEVLYGVEPTASYHKPLAEYLLAHGDHVVYVSNVAVKRNRELLDGRWDKNDKKDCANVADLLSQGRFLYYDCQYAAARELTELIRRRMWLRKQIHRIRMRIRNHLVAQYFPELDEHFLAESVALSVVRDFLDPRRIAAQDNFQFTGDLGAQKATARQYEHMEAIWTAAQHSVGCPVPEAAQEEARLLVDRLRQFRTDVAEAEGRIEKVAQSFPEYACLRSIPGFGPLVSAMVLSAIVDPHRFESHRQVLRLAGLDLSASRSGKTSQTAVPVISKQGKAELRYLLIQAAQVASALDANIRRYYTQLLKGREMERGIRLKMKVKLGAKFLVVAWTLMKRREKFDPKHFDPERLR